jgi:NAD-dependent dihydropyrimidine dehydrogenase PreA subunit
VCPVDCFYDIKKKKYNDKFGIAPKDSDDGMLMIHPDECINCGACETECPVEAIFEDTGVPEEWKEFVKINEEETAAMSDSELDAARCTSKG